jgi:predicted permease
VLAFTLVVSLATGIVFGTVPALQMLRVDLHQTLKQGGSKGTSAGFRGVERGLVVAEVALAFVLALSAALFLQSFARLRGVDPGFRAAGILTMRTPISARQYSDPAKRAAYYDQVLARVGALAGVVSAGFTNGLPLVLKGNVNGLQAEGQPALGRDVFSNANYRVVTPDYLRTIGVPLRDGRQLDRRDTADAPRVAVINEAMKRKFWPAGSALGKRFRFGDRAPWTTVVGVAGDILQGGLDRPPKPEMYLPAAQEPAAAICLAVRTTGDPRGLAAAVRREIRAVDKSVPILEVRTMEDVLDREVFQRRVQMVLLQIFAGVALLLASLGIYGVLACLVAQRTREIGIRMALGASPASVLWTVAGQGMGLSVAGIAAGAAAAMAVTRVLSKLLFGIAATDPATFAAVGALLVAVASVASYVPARRAMRVDPILALREE